MNNGQDFDEVQERQVIDKWLQWSSTILGILLIIGVLIVVVLHIMCGEEFPKPVDLEASLFFGFGVLLVILFNFPWTKIRLGDLEVERIIDEQETDHAEEISKLNEIIEAYESSVEDLQDITLTPKAKKTIESIKIKRSEEERDEELLLKFLNEWSSWGFTATRIINWGGRQSGFERFGDLSKSYVRFLAGNLIRQGKARSRISSNGNILYQSKDA